MVLITSIALPTPDRASRIVYTFDYTSLQGTQPFLPTFPTSESDFSSPTFPTTRSLWIQYLIWEYFIMWQSDTGLSIPDFARFLDPLVRAFRPATFPPKTAYRRLEILLQVFAEGTNTQKCEPTANSFAIRHKGGNYPIGTCPPLGGPENFLFERGDSENADRDAISKLMVETLQYGKITLPCAAHQEAVLSELQRRTDYKANTPLLELHGQTQNQPIIDDPDDDDHSDDEWDDHSDDEDDSENPFLTQLVSIAKPPDGTAVTAKKVSPETAAETQSEVVYKHLKSRQHFTLDNMGICNGFLEYC
ncbi:hypothetical protein BDZ89DRAFT_1050431 [Hymenopellis radicata]|nr:hypothetical protein BDZ89DRAFT_1050431 [Hymenopellis radicata]